MRVYFFLILILLIGCDPGSMEEYRYEGESVSRLLCNDLVKIESTGDLKAQAPKLKKKFVQLTELMIKAKKHQLMHPEEVQIREVNMYLSDQLKMELMRLYQIEGCQMVIEDLQRESLHKLDLFAEQYSKN